MSVRVRFAPSPTGYLHVGGLRTALYNYLFAKKYGGKIILRIEDTDRSRLVENAVENLIESLSWAGIVFDESPINQGDFGPYIQSERLDIYKYHAQLLINNGSAYYAFDTADEIEAMRSRNSELKLNSKYDKLTMKNQYTLGDEKTKTLLNSNVSYVIRLNVPENSVNFSDIIRGEIIVNGFEIDDQVLVKSDGYPTYHLANVVDDHLMGITHVIRGEEWLPSTPKHILLYKSFGWDLPEFAHLPLLLNKDKSKLSKRQGDVAVEDYRNKGYLRDAFINFIALLGWNPTGDREIYSIDELIESFQLDKVNKGGAVFDTVKLDWMNAYYLRNVVEPEILLIDLRNIIKDKLKLDFSDDYLMDVFTLFKERLTFLHEIVTLAPYMFSEPDDYDEEYFKKHWKENTKDLIVGLKTVLEQIENFTNEILHNEVVTFIENNGYKLKEIIHPLRFLLTGRSSGAGMFETMEVLGKSKCLKRIDNFLVNRFL